MNSFLKMEFRMVEVTPAGSFAINVGNEKWRTAKEILCKNGSKLVYSDLRGGRIIKCCVMQQDLTSLFAKPVLRTNKKLLNKFEVII